MLSDVRCCQKAKDPPYHKILMYYLSRNENHSLALCKIKLKCIKISS